MKIISKLSLITLIIGLLIVVISTGLTSCSSSSDTGGSTAVFDTADISNGVFKHSATISGKKYAEWSVAWWQWVMGVPSINNNQIYNPLLDTTGAQSGLGHQGSSIFFLAGIVNKPDAKKNVIRTVTIPHTYAIFFPLAAMLQDPFIAGTSNTDTMKARLNRFIGIEAGDANVKLDGAGLITLTNRNLYRTSNATAFSYSVPTDNLYTYMSIGVAAGAVTPAFADGYYIMLAPLAVGSHDLTFNAVIRGVVKSVTYKITSN